MKLLLLVALLFCASHQFGMKSDRRTSAMRGTASPQKRLPGGNGYNSGMGPYDIDIKLLHECEDPGTDLLKFNLEAYNTKTDGVSKILYRGNMTVPFTQDQINALTVKLRIYRRKDNKYFQMLKYDENMCKTVSSAGKDVFRDFRKELGQSGDQMCLFPEGVYLFNDWSVKTELPPPVLEYGYYKATLELLHDNQTCLCLETHGVVMQKG